MLKKLKKNPKLSYDSLTNIIEIEPHLMIAPKLESIAKELMKIFIEEFILFSKSENEKLIDKNVYTVQELREMFNARMTIDVDFENDEWLLLVKNKLYYSNGTEKD